MCVPSDSAHTVLVVLPVFLFKSVLFGFSTHDTQTHRAQLRPVQLYKESVRYWYIPKFRPDETQWCPTYRSGTGTGTGTGTGASREHGGARSHSSRLEPSNYAKRDLF